MADREGNIHEIISPSFTFRMSLTTLRELSCKLHQDAYHYSPAKWPGCLMPDFDVHFQSGHLYFLSTEQRVGEGGKVIICQHKDIHDF